MPAQDDPGLACASSIGNFLFYGEICEPICEADDGCGL